MRVVGLGEIQGDHAIVVARDHLLVLAVEHVEREPSLPLAVSVDGQAELKQLEQQPALRGFRLGKRSRPSSTFSGRVRVNAQLGHSPPGPASPLQPISPRFAHGSTARSAVISRVVQSNASGVWDCRQSRFSNTTRCRQSGQVNARMTPVPFPYVESFRTIRPVFARPQNEIGQPLARVG